MCVVSEYIRVFISVGGFVTQMEYRRIIILEKKCFYIWKEHGTRIRKNMSAMFSLPFVYFADQTKMTS